MRRVSPKGAKVVRSFIVFFVLALTDSRRTLCLREKKVVEYDYS